MNKTILKLVEGITICKLSLYIKHMGIKSLIGDFSDVLIENAEIDDLRRLSHQLDELLDEISIQDCRYKKIIQLFKLDEIAMLALNLCLLEFSHPRISQLLEKIQKKSNATGVDIELVFKIINNSDNILNENILSMRENFEKVNSLLIFEVAEIPFFRYRLFCDERLYCFLCGSDEIDKHLVGIAKINLGKEQLQELYIGNEYKCQISNFLKTNLIRKNKDIIHISAERGMGKKLYLSHSCYEIGLKVIFLDYKAMLSYEISAMNKIIKFAKREAVLNEYAICFYNLRKENCSSSEQINKFINICLKSFIKTDIPVAVLSDNSVKLSPYYNSFIFKIDIENCNRAEQTVLWEKYATKYSLKYKIDGTEFSNKFKLSAEGISKVLMQISKLELMGNAISPKIIAKVCYDVMIPVGAGDIKHIDTLYTLEDLKLAKEQKATLENICNHVRFKDKVFDKWNMESRYAYGKGVSALFVGPPGTGKTMSANVIAGMLGLELYRIDISQVVDKYIGETEKKLEEAFNTAENSNVILFFDEADSIFGKRSDVNDSKDRYANTETSYILQRLEDYNGIVILASNFRKNIDDAFMRRIRYVIEFQMPSFEVRKEIWQSSFSNKVPLKDIDFDYLARQFEFSGGSIKNVVLNSTFLAAARNDAVTMKYILDSIKAESLKMNKVLLKQDFGAYGHCLD